MSNFSNPFRLDGEVALITGGATGLGLGIARAMLAAGAKVVLVSRKAEALSQVAAELGDACAFDVHDVTEEGAADDVVHRAASHFGPITVLVNNAGIHKKFFALETSEADMVEVFRTHIVGAHGLSRAVLPSMLEHGSGSIINIASMASLFGIPQLVAYSAAKSACLGMIRTYAVEYSGRGIRINGIAPGWIDSAMSRKALEQDPGRRDRILQRTPMGRLGEAADIGHAAVYLASPAAQFITGTVLTVDGGISVGF